MYFVYILQTSSDTLYIGQTSNLERRSEAEAVAETPPEPERVIPAAVFAREEVEPEEE